MSPLMSRALFALGGLAAGLLSALGVTAAIDQPSAQLTEAQAKLIEAEARVAKLEGELSSVQSTADDGADATGRTDLQAQVRALEKDVDYLHDQLNRRSEDDGLYISVARVAENVGRPLGVELSEEITKDGPRWKGARKRFKYDMTGIECAGEADNLDRISVTICFAERNPDAEADISAAAELLRLAFIDWTSKKAADWLVDAGRRSDWKTLSTLDHCEQGSRASVFLQPTMGTIRLTITRDKARG